MNIEHPIKTDISILLALGVAILAATASLLLYLIEHAEVLLVFVREGLVITKQTVGFLFALPICTTFLAIFIMILKSLSFARSVAWRAFRASEMKQSSIGTEAFNSNKDGVTNIGQKFTLEQSNPSAKTIVTIKNLDDYGDDD